MLYYRFADALKQAAMVSFEPGWEQRLGAIMRYAAASSTCRRSLISRCAPSPNTAPRMIPFSVKVSLLDRERDAQRSICLTFAKFLHHCDVSKGGLKF